MFTSVIENQTNEEQFKLWYPQANNFEIIGTYAQSEMGHGTFIRGLETTATYDPKTEEFIINSPTLTSLKWWPGGLGKTSNHAVVMAVLYTKGKNEGTHAFMVQLRDLDTHEPLPGIRLGDIGPKFGYDSMDNGFLGFDNVRIPRQNMLMKNSQVLRDGTYIKPKSSKLSYGTMVFIRSMLVSDVAAKGLAQTCTIAIRYSTVRKQSEMKPGAPEPKVLEYQTQQYKLFPLLATTYAYWFTGKWLSEMYFSINSEIQKGNTALLPELHGVSAGLKAFCTKVASDGMEMCRMACGGHGYSQASGIPKIFLNCTPGCTYEGENTVMLLQCARYLIKNLNRSKSGEAISGSCSYLSEPNNTKCAINQNLNLAALRDAYKHRASRMVKKAGSSIQKWLSRGKPYYEAWNMSSVELTKAAEAHCHYCVVKTFSEKVERERQNVSPSLFNVLMTLCKLYAVHGIYENSGEFLEDGFMSSEQHELVIQKVMELMSAIRPNAVALVDAFDFPDHVLGSVLGRYDGNVYENLYKWALASPLNEKQVHDSYHKYLKPMLQENRAQSKL